MKKHTLSMMLLAGALLLLPAGAPLAAQTMAHDTDAVLVAPPPAPTAAASGGSASGAPDAAAAAATLARADSLVGARYRFGGQSPARGFDCSGFVRYVYAAHGVVLPRTARQMAGAGVPVAKDTAALRPGDLLFFRLTKRGVDHVAIYAGNGRIVHAASRRRRTVRYDELASDRGRYYLARLAAVRRVLDGPPPAFAATAAGNAHYVAWNGSVPRP